MSYRNVGITVSDKVIPTKSDQLLDCLTVEAVEKINVSPGSVVQVNLIVRNSSNVGRMAHLHVNYDPNLGIVVQIPDPKIFVGPESRTATYALIEAKLGAKNVTSTGSVSFGVS